MDSSKTELIQKMKTALVQLTEAISSENRTAHAEVLASMSQAAQAVQALAQELTSEPVQKIATGLVRMLSRHWERNSWPTAVEFEAMQLAVEWLVQLLETVPEHSSEPLALVDEVMKALALAEHFPGKTPLVELLDSQSEHRSPKLDDPFATDPPLSLDDQNCLQVAEDPFAEDPEFGLEFDAFQGLSTGPLEKKTPTEIAGGTDPFAEDPGLKVAEDLLPETIFQQNSSGSKPIADPFADDPGPE